MLELALLKLQNFLGMYSKVSVFLRNTSKETDYIICGSSYFHLRKSSGHNHEQQRDCIKVHLWMSNCKGTAGSLSFPDFFSQELQAGPGTIRIALPSSYPFLPLHRSLHSIFVDARQI